MTNLSYDHESLALLCRDFHVRRLAVFGSMLTGKERAESDLDLLVEFDPDNGPGWDMFKLEDRLSTLFGRKVDLNTPGFISRYFRDEILRSAQTIYVNA
jgi:uncharacterized protein